MTVISFAVILPMVGLAIDTSLIYAAKAKLQAAVDAAALAGARSLNRGMDIGSQTESARATAQAFFDANFPAGHLGTTNRVSTFTVAESDYRTRTVRADAGIDVPAYFMRLLGFQSTHLTATGMASRRDVNLVLVLDRSSSMSGAMSAMRSAARSFVDKFAEGRDNVGLIVFGGSGLVAFPNPSPSGPASNFKSASPNVDTLISQTVNGGNTGTAQALSQAYLELVKRNEAGALNLIVFFTDGLPNGLMANFNDPDPAKNLLRSTSTCIYRGVAGRPMLGFLSQYSSFAPTGTTVGIKKPSSSTVSTVSEGPITTNSDGCYYRSNEQNMRQDVLKMPALDYYGNLTTGYHSVDLTRVDSPQQIGYASLNAADSAVQRIRQDSGLNIVIYTIGYHGGSEQPDETWLKRVANDPSSPSFDSLKPPGLYVKAPTTGDLAAAFSKVASEILRLAL
ncbi:MAG: VWA domain-containing protein [Bryobacteraceae bacterium]